MKTKITRKSKNVGFGYTAGAVQGEHGLYVPLPDYPTHTGTIKTVLRDLEFDGNYQYFQNGDIIYNTAWMVKIDGIWFRILKRQGPHPLDLLQKFSDNKYLVDSVELEIEPIES